MTSHAAVVARGMGKCCVAACSDLDIDYTKFEIIFIMAMFFTACNEKKQIILKEERLSQLIYWQMLLSVRALFYRQNTVFN